MCPLGTSAITFEIYSPHTQWVCDGRIDSVPTMNSPCTHWVNDPLPPVLPPLSMLALAHHPPLPQNSINPSLSYPSVLSSQIVHGPLPRLHLEWTPKAQKMQTRCTAALAQAC